MEVVRKRLVLQKAAERIVVVAHNAADMAGVVQRVAAEADFERNQAQAQDKEAGNFALEAGCKFVVRQRSLSKEEQHTAVDIHIQGSLLAQLTGDLLAAFEQEQVYYYHCCLRHFVRRPTSRLCALQAFS